MWRILTTARNIARSRRCDVVVRHPDDLLHQHQSTFGGRRKSAPFYTPDKWTKTRYLESLLPPESDLVAVDENEPP
jgi:hypothetical protein